MSRRKPKGLAHVGIERRTLKEEHWQGLSAAAKIFYIHLKGRYNGQNNGNIKLSYGAMSDVIGCCNRHAISKAIKELETKGWIKRTRKGALYRYPNIFKLTWKYDLYGSES